MSRFLRIDFLQDKNLFVRTIERPIKEGEAAGLMRLRVSDLCSTHLPLKALEAACCEWACNYTCLLPAAPASAPCKQCAATTCRC